MAVSSNAFRQICDKPSSLEISCMKWSSKNDLISILTVEGEVRLHRLYWSKVWSLSEKTTKHTAIGWSPDGTVLAVGNSEGCLKLFEIEKCQCISSNSLCSEITCIEWIQGKQQSMSVLIAGTKNGKIYLFINGMFKIAVLNQGEQQSGDCLISNIHISPNLQLLLSVYTTQGIDWRRDNLISFHEIKLLSTRTEEVAAVAVKYEKVHNLMMRFQTELKQVSESWENILQKVGSKLSQFSDMLPVQTSIAEEFLSAFAIGIPSPELHSFLINDLTTKGLRKFGNDVNRSYDNIQSNVVDKIQSLCYELSFELTELLGMARWYDKYGILGLCENTVQESLRYLGSFMLKIRELVNVIHKDLRSFRSFFKWLTGVMLRISEEPIPNACKEFNEEDYALILNFLQTQLVEKPEHKTFILDRVGQYVQKGDLDIKLDEASNPWYEFVRESAVLRDNPLVILPDGSRSLVDMSDELQQRIDDVFKKVTDMITESVTTKARIAIPDQCSSEKENCTMRVSCLSGDANNNITMCILPCCCGSNNFRILQTNEKDENNPSCFSCEININKIPHQERSTSETTVLRDVSCYDETTLTLLVEDEVDNEMAPTRILLQLPIESCIEDQSPSNSISTNQPTYDVSSHVTKWRNLNSFDPCMMSVSGTRRVACLLSKNKRRVLIFDMDAEDEEDDEDDEDEAEDEMEAE